VSYGEERPAVTGHAEEAWARNRRVDIVYLN
jgi:peptidoglycan-associated lipoprotein